MHPNPILGLPDILDINGYNCYDTFSQMAEIYNFISSRQQEVFEKKFEDLDMDGNGVITLQELFSRMYKGKDKDTGRAFMQVCTNPYNPGKL